jgi:hypothetical protein
MTHRLRRAGGAAILPTGALVVALIALPGRTELALHVWLLVVLGIALVALVAGVYEDVPLRPSGLAQALVPARADPARPPSLARVEREVSMGAETAFDTHYRLRPLFRELARGMLVARDGVDLDRSPERARELVGDDLWALIRPGVPAPEERGGPGMPGPAIERAVTDLERLAWS